ncbi:MAG: hypothetical protein IV105_24980 [Rhizobacter sp.]|nr:hypothetical protein [Rhizobacter sp.]
MTVRIKELVIRWEDDGEVSPLSAEEHRMKYRPLKMDIHHHCSPPPNNPQNARPEDVAGDQPQSVTIDLQELAKQRLGSNQAE